MLRPAGNPQPQRELSRARRRHLDAHVTFHRIYGGLCDHHRESRFQRHTEPRRPVVVDRDSGLPDHHRPIAEHPQPARAIDAAAVQLRASGPRLEDDVMRTGETRPVGGRIVRRPATRGRVHPQHRVQRRHLELVGYGGITGELQHLHTHRQPRDGATGLDRTGVVRIARGFLTRREAAVVVPVVANNGPPDPLEGLTVIGVAGQPVELNQPHNRVQALPTRLGHLEELPPVQRHPQIVTGQRPIRPLRCELTHDLLRQRQVAWLPCPRVEHRQRVHRRQVLVCLARVHHPYLGRARKEIVEQITDPPGRSKRLVARRAGRLIVPEHQPQHHVVVTPRIPRGAPTAHIRRRPREMAAGRPRPQIAVVILQADEVSHEFRNPRAQSLIPGGPQHLDRARQILPRELAGPRHHIAVGYPIAIREHLQHRRIRFRRH